MIQTSEHYDVILVGRTTSSLAAAALLSKRRLRVRLLDVVGGVPEDPVPLFGHQSSPIVPILLEELGLKHHFRTIQEPDPCGLTVALSDRRFVFHSDVHERGEVLGAMFPEDRGSIVSLFRFIEKYGAALDPILMGDLESPPGGFRARRAWKRAMESLSMEPTQALPSDVVDSGGMVELLNALLRVAGRPAMTLGHLSLPDIRSLWHICHGMSSVRGGRSGFDDMLEQKLRSSGGTFESRRRAAGLEVKRNRVKAVLTEDGMRFGAEAVIVAGGPEGLSNMWPQAPSSETLTGYQYACTIPPRERPANLKDPCVWYQTGERQSILVRLSGEEVLFHWWGTEEPPDPDRLAPFAQIQSGSLVPFQVAGHGRIDEMHLFHQHPMGLLKNVVFVGPLVMPGLGLESDFFTAWQGASWVERLVSKGWFA